MSDFRATYPFLSWDEAERKVQAIKAQGGKVVSTNGCFDLLHVGHVSLLEEARKLGDFLIVGINSDASVKRLKGSSRPLNTENSRAVVLRALRCVDAICLFDQDTPLEWLQKIQPAIHVKGGDYKAEKLPETALLKSWGASVVILPFIEGHSTTSLIDRAKNIFSTEKS
jgi:rfaE bifunctional protein nucleotidyltransferase chain/domain